MENQTQNFDVVICGGGLAGLTLSRQLKLTDPELSVAVLERTKRPIHAHAFKVGESSVEVGAHYYAKVLELEDHIEAEHYEKLGLRYFYGGHKEDFTKRSEFGVADYIPIKSYQFSRGKFESHLRELVTEQGVQLLEGINIKDIQLEQGEEAHTVSIKDAEGQDRQLQARWVVDASGRRRLLQNKLGFSKKAPFENSAIWFRIDKVISVDELVDRDKTDWFGRVNEPRWFSTNHLMGKGYWVWLIPLNKDVTSVGIVANEEHHPFTSYNSKENTLKWLGENEPAVLKLLEGCEMLDFKKLKNYSYSSTRVFSEDRWACVGEAGVFSDPYYSIGSNMIAYSNSITAEMIHADKRGDLTPETVTYYNNFFLTLNEALTYNVQAAYPMYNDPKKMALKTIWDYTVGWGLSDPLFYHKVFLNPQLSKVVSSLLTSIIVTQSRMIQFFLDWAKLQPEEHEFGWIDYVDGTPFLKDLLIRNTKNDTSLSYEIINNIKFGVDKAEELAQILFKMAVREIYPDKYEMIKDKWLNAEAITLNPENWEEDGLFTPTTEPRDYSALEEEIMTLLSEELVC